LPVVSPFVFYPMLAWEFLSKYAGVLAMHRRYRRILDEVLADPDPGAYGDTAMTPVEKGEEEVLQLFTATVAAREFVKKKARR